MLRQSRVSRRHGVSLARPARGNYCCKDGLIQEQTRSLSQTLDLELRMRPVTNVVGTRFDCAIFSREVRTEASKAPPEAMVEDKALLDLLFHCDRLRAQQRDGLLYHLPRSLTSLVH